MDGGLEVAMQVEHQVGVAGVAIQQALHALQFRGRRRQGVQRRAQGLADQRDIGRRIAAETLADAVDHRVQQVGKSRLKLRPLLISKRPWCSAWIICPRPTGLATGTRLDGAAQAAFRLQQAQPLLQLPGGAHARQLVGVQAGLDVDLARAAAEAEHAQALLASQGAPRQQVVDTLHAVLRIRICAAPGRPASGARQANRRTRMKVRHR